MTRCTSLRALRALRALTTMIVGVLVGIVIPGVGQQQLSSQAPQPPVVRFLLGGVGGFDQRGFAQEYATALRDIDFQVVSGAGGGGTRLEDIQNGDADLTINASQTTYLAYSGRLAGTKTKYDRLRAISALGVVPLHLVARADSGIRSVSDLRGHPVAVGLPDGENHRMAQMVLDAFEIKAGAFEPHHYSYGESAAKLADGAVHAMFMVGAYPVVAVRDATARLGARLVAIDGPPADRMRARNGFVHPALIPAGTYVGQTTSTRTVGVQQLLVCSRDLDERVVYELTRQLFAVLPRVSSQLTSLRSMDVNQAPATPIPLHDGAARYYRERELSR